MGTENDAKRSWKGGHVRLAMCYAAIIFAWLVFCGIWCVRDFATVTTATWLTSIACFFAVAGGGLSLPDCIFRTTTRGRFFAALGLTLSLLTLAICLWLFYRIYLYVYVFTRFRF
jgi:hypothetical protein